MTFTGGSQKSEVRMQVCYLGHTYFHGKIVRKRPISTAQQVERRTQLLLQNFCFPVTGKLFQGRTQLLSNTFSLWRTQLGFMVQKLWLLPLRQKTTLINKRKYEYLRDRTTSSLSLRNWHAYNGNLLWVCTHLVLNEKIVYRLLWMRKRIRK